MKNLLSLGDFRNGLMVGEDPTNAPVGSARKITNGIITDRGGISKRKGISILGEYDDTKGRCRGFKVFKKTDTITEIPMKAVNSGELQYFNPETESWSVLKDGFTESSNFGFTHGFVRTGNVDFMYGGNKNENDFKWQGTVTYTDTISLITATTIQVPSVFRPDIYESKTATSSSTTTLDVAAGSYVADQYNGFYVYIKSGTQAGVISKITDTGTAQITFGAITDPGNCDFEIRYCDFAASGTLIVGGTEVVYSAIPTYNTFTVTALAAEIAADTPLTIAVVENQGAPRGNRMCFLVGRRYVGNVLSGLSRDSDGVLGGSAQPGSIFISKVVNGLFPGGSLEDFTYASPRVAGEGDVIGGVLGGAGHVDILVHNNAVYMFKDYAIESVIYSQDSDDLANIEQPSPNYGASMRPIKGKDDVYFVTSDKQFTTLGLVNQKTGRELATNIGIPVKRLLQEYSYDRNAKGGVYQNRVHLPAKDSSDATATNRLLIYNMDEQKPRFEGEWWLNVDTMDIFNNELCYSSSINSSVYKLYQGLNDEIDGENSYPISFEWLANWINSTGSNFTRQSANLFACEGYITDGSKLEFGLYKNLQSSPFFSFDFYGTETGLVDSDISSAFKGSLPLSIQPKGAFGGELDNEGRRHFLFYIYFPFEYGEQFSWGFKNSDLNASFEVIRAGLNPSSDTVYDLNNRIKQLT